MTTKELDQVHAGAKIKQLGHRLIYITPAGHMYGYTIAAYGNDYTPATVYEHAVEHAPLTPAIKTWDDAHDALFGAPDSRGPIFGANLLNNDKAGL